MSASAGSAAEALADAEVEYAKSSMATCRVAWLAAVFWKGRSVFSFFSHFCIDYGLEMGTQKDHIGKNGENLWLLGVSFLPMA